MGLPFCCAQDVGMSASTCPMFTPVCSCPTPVGVFSVSFSSSLSLSHSVQVILGLWLSIQHHLLLVSGQASSWQSPLAQPGRGLPRHACMGQSPAHSLPRSP